MIFVNLRCDIQQLEIMDDNTQGKSLTRTYEVLRESRSLKIHGNLRVNLAYHMKQSDTEETNTGKAQDFKRRTVCTTVETKQAKKLKTSDSRLNKTSLPKVQLPSQKLMY